ncbi:LOW QUALITY PROTEIN: multifunctional methyltransferase subunit TRM112-like protein [Lacerta agilis]|uniref:LOW QUALITY PROTEIN: multifunctional methyltransferase subunit TRM112-like protein n=1 Tax=Lacerta agilis TaxID=80427 RepID=UPI00141A199B|nr:LOW QUALITY PROTEIN: multifunctional methyltransferase subunit TRM112-like protein [Lacerta agilis]
MKLPTHNVLTSHVRGGKPGGGFPLRIQALEVKVNNVDFNPEFRARMVPKVEWAALVEAAESLVTDQDLPPEPIPDFENNEDFLRKVHHVLMEVEVVESVLKCPNTGREFPITKGIPNMLLSEEET